MDVLPILIVSVNSALEQTTRLIRGLIYKNGVFITYILISASQRMLL
jgi:hypothetical protein